MAMTTKTEPQIRAHVTSQKAHRSQIFELAHVYQFVGQQPLTVTRPCANEDDVAQRDRLGLGRHGAANHDPIAVALLHSHVVTLSL